MPNQDIDNIPRDLSNELNRGQRISFLLFVGNAKYIAFSALELYKMTAFLSKQEFLNDAVFAKAMYFQ